MRRAFTLLAVALWAAADAAIVVAVLRGELSPGALGLAAMWLGAGIVLAFGWPRLSAVHPLAATTMCLVLIAACVLLATLLGLYFIPALLALLVASAPAPRPQAPRRASRA